VPSPEEILLNILGEVCRGKCLEDECKVFSEVLERLEYSLKLNEELDENTRNGIIIGVISSHIERMIKVADEKGCTREVELLKEASYYISVLLQLSMYQRSRET